MTEDFLNRYYIGDCITMMKEHIPDNSVDLVVTSPPYAMQRANQYGGIPEEEYPEWTVAWMQEVKRVLKDTGNVAINIRPHIKNGQISDYTLKTRLALREDGWIEAEELIWIKDVSPALGSYYRPRRSWESIHWFSKDWKPFVNLTARGKQSSGIGFIKNKGVGDYVVGVSAGVDGVARVPDYVKVGTNLNDRSKYNIHPAQYPVPLAEWLIELMCPVGGIVLDPFLGSGTTAVAAINTERKWIGCEINEEYKEIIEKRITEKYVNDYEEWISY